MKVFTTVPKWLGLRFLPIFNASLVTTLFMFPVALLASIFRGHLRSKVCYLAWPTYSRLLIWLGCFSGIKILDKRTEKYRFEPKGLVICNHQSICDIPVLQSTVGAITIMKKSILYYPIFGFIAYMSGIIAVDRKDPNSRKKTFYAGVKKLKEGRSLLYYPEGTRNKKEGPKPYEEIHRSFISMAYKLKVKVHPFSIYGTDKVFKNGFLKPFSPLGIMAHEALDPKEFSSEDEFCRSCWAKVQDGYKELKEHFRQT